MKSEHRHQLETNYLSARLARWIESLKPFTGQIFTGFAALIIAYLGLKIWDSQTVEREKAAWDAFALATDTSDLELKGLQRIASDEQYRGTNMQEWAYVGWADRQVLIAIQNYLYDREKSEDLLRSVAGIYEELGSNAGDPQVLNRARFGLARVYELQNKLDEALSQYLTVRGDLQPQASERAKQLGSEQVRDACLWLATAELPSRDQTGGQGATGLRPNFEANLPATQPTGDGITAESFEALLREAQGDNRYGEKDAAADPAAEDSATEEAAETDSTNTDGESESPAEPTADEAAPTAEDGAAQE